MHAFRREKSISSLELMVGFYIDENPMIGDILSNVFLSRLDIEPACSILSITESLFPERFPEVVSGNLGENAFSCCSSRKSADFSNLLISMLP